MSQVDEEDLRQAAEEAQARVDALKSHYDTVMRLQEIGFTAKLSKQKFTPPQHPKVTFELPTQSAFRIILWDSGVSFSYSEGVFTECPQYAEDMIRLHALVVVVAEILVNNVLPPASLFREHGLWDATWDDTRMDVCDSGYIGDGLWHTGSGAEDLGR